MKPVDPAVDVKATILTIVGDQPSESTYDEVLRELAFHRMVRHALSGDLSHRMATDEIRRRLRTWHG